MNEPSLLRGLTTKLVAFCAPAGAQLVGIAGAGATLAAKLHRLTAISPENVGFASAPAARPGLTGEVFCSAIEATMPLSERSSPESM